MKNIVDILSKYQNYLLGLAVFLSLFAVSISIGEGQIKLNWQNYPVVMIFLVLASIILALTYIAIDKYRIQNLSKKIKQQTIEKAEGIDALLSELTSRQQEVYKLIISDKTNKEIMADLFIEQSTLKTHINQIYKKLKIKNRKELKSKVIRWLPSCNSRFNPFSTPWSLNF